MWDTTGLMRGECIWLKLKSNNTISDEHITYIQNNDNDDNVCIGNHFRLCVISTVIERLARSLIQLILFDVVLCAFDFVQSLSPILEITVFNPTKVKNSKRNSKPLPYIVVNVYNFFQAIVPSILRIRFTRCTVLKLQYQIISSSLIDSFTNNCWCKTDSLIFSLITRTRDDRKNSNTIWKLHPQQTRPTSYGKYSEPEIWLYFIKSKCVCVCVCVWNVRVHSTARQSIDCVRFGVV